MNTFIARRPLTFAMLIMLLLEAVVLAGLVISRVLGVPLLALDAPLLLINAIIAIILLTSLGWWRDAGFNAPSQWQDLRLLLPPLLLLIGPSLLLQPQIPAPGKMVALVIMTLLIGFQEEAIFRGLLLRALAPRGTKQAILISAFLFGIIHANSLLVGRDSLFVLSQVVASFLGAIALGALRVRLNTVWPLVVMHALNDFIQFSAVGGLEAEQVPLYVPLVKFGIAAILALYGWYLLRSQPERQVSQLVSTEGIAA